MAPRSTVPERAGHILFAARQATFPSAKGPHVSGVRTIDMALRSVAPDRLVEALDGHLCEVYGAKGSTVWLADYRATVLAPLGVRDLPDADVQLAAAARTYASQTPV